jgi:two-component system OmpR family response regulator
MTAGARPRRRVLVVDDEPTIAEVVARYLERAGHDTRVAGDGAAALAALEGWPADLVVLDLMLPGIDGLEVLRRLRAGTGPAPAVILLTARGAESDRITGLRQGADDYVVKPFSFEVLLARVRSLLRRGVPERPVRLEVGDLVLDPASRQATRAGVALRLTTREMSLLELLMRRSGDVLTKQQIMSNVWDYGFEGDPNIIEVYIARLRNKVDRLFGRADIETLRGSGYRLRLPED